MVFSIICAGGAARTGRRTDRRRIADASTSPGVTKRPSRRWCGGTARWSSASAGASCAPRPTPRTLFRRRSSSWSARRPPSGRERRWQLAARRRLPHGPEGAGRRCEEARQGKAGRRDGQARSARRRWEELLPLLDQELHRSRNSIACRSSSATWRASRTRRRRSRWAGRRGRSQAGCRAAGRSWPGGWPVTGRLLAGVRRLSCGLPCRRRWQPSTAKAATGVRRVEGFPGLGQGGRPGGRNGESHVADEIESGHRRSCCWSRVAGVASPSVRRGGRSSADGPCSCEGASK